MIFFLNIIKYLKKLTKMAMEEKEYNQFYKNIFDFIFDLPNMFTNNTNTLNIVIGLNVLNGGDIERFVLNNTGIPIHVGWDRYTQREIEMIEKNINHPKILNQDFNDSINSETLDLLSYSNENMTKIDRIMFDYSTTKNLTSLSCLILLYHFLKKEGSIYIPFSTIKQIRINRDKTVTQSSLYGWNMQTYYDNIHLCPFLS